MLRVFNQLQYKTGWLAELVSTSLKVQRQQWGGDGVICLTKCILHVGCIKLLHWAFFWKGHEPRYSCTVLEASTRICPRLHCGTFQQGLWHSWDRSLLSDSIFSGRVRLSMNSAQKLETRRTDSKHAKGGCWGQRSPKAGRVLTLTAVFGRWQHITICCCNEANSIALHTPQLPLL